jgi:tetratricopeptide (TPR) repeat protein
MAWLAKLFRQPDPPMLAPVRRSAGTSAAIILVHGFTGRVNTSFGNLVDVIAKDARFDGFDVFRLQYSSNLRLDLQFVQRQPDIALLGRQLATRLKTEPLQRYRTTYVIAHSMGGLVVESALLDDEARARVSHVMLIGTPSRGVRNIGLLAGLMGQLRDLVFDSGFIRELRAAWTTKFAAGTPFALATVAGDSDELVDPDSSLEPFPHEAQMPIAGTHGSIASVDSASHPLFGVLVRLLNRHTLLHSDADFAKLALEQHNYRRVVELLGPSVAKLDKSAVTTLALAYDALGDRERAIEVLEAMALTESDAIGVLAGRYKRRWLSARLADDFEKSRSLYLRALEQARASEDKSQIWYHAINLAFLEVLATPDGTSESPAAGTFAAEALGAAQNHAEQNYWSAVTAAEAKIVAQDYGEALAAYASAMQYESSIRERESTFLNASQLLSKRRRSDLLEPLFATLLK